MRACEAMQRICRNFSDAVMVLLALAFGSVSLTYPFSRDQGLFYYVGREWFERGRIPYRDLFEQKSPFIFALHAVLIAVTGKNMWAIRAAELCAVALSGWLAAELARARGERPLSGTFGVATIAVTTFYYGYFSFEDTGNCEIWCVVFALAATRAARHVKRETLAPVIAGACIALAVLAKPPALLFAALPVVELVSRFRDANRPRALARFVAGGLAVASVTLAYFVAHRALGAFFDVVVRANMEHAAQASSSFSDAARLTLFEMDWFSPISYIAIGGASCAFAFGFFRRDRELLKCLFSAGLAFALTFLAVLIQLKFFRYYFALFALPYAMLCAQAYVLVAKKIDRPMVAMMFAIASISISVFMVPRDVWREHAASAVRRIRFPDRDPLATFTSGASHVDLENSARVGAWIDLHSTRSDTIVVRGYEPQIYAFADRHFDGRFFWSTFLTDPRRVYRREEWLAEDRRALAQKPPRYVVAYETAPAVESASFFESLGYARRVQFGAFIVLEKSL